MIDESRNFYRQFDNVESDLEQVLTDAQNEALQEIQQFDEISNLDDDNDLEMEIDEFDSSQACLEKFGKTLLPKSDNNNNQLCHVILLS